MRTYFKRMMASLALTAGAGSILAQGAAPATTPIAPRTNSYGEVAQGNAAAENTVSDYTKRPTLIAGKQYFAGSLTGGAVDGYYSFEGMGLDWFGAMTTTTSAPGGPGEVRAGIANGPMGAGVIVNFKKSSITDPAGNRKHVVAGDGYGAFGDFSLGTSDVYGEIAAYTGPGPYDKVEPPAANPTTEDDPWTLRVIGGWKKSATTEGTHALNVEASFSLFNRNVDPGAVKTTSNTLTAMFTHGYILRANSSYSVFLGSAINFMWSKTDNPAPAADPELIGLVLGPNIVFQKQLGHGFETFAGGSSNLGFLKLSNSGVPGGTPVNLPPLSPAAPQDANVLYTTSATMAIGLRWALENFAVEGRINNTLLSNGPQFISGTATPGGLYATVGLSLGI